MQTQVKLILNILSALHSWQLGFIFISIVMILSNFISGMHCLVFFIGGLLCLIPGGKNFLNICIEELTRVVMFY